MSDMTAVIIPRSDQINADSLLSGPITIKITKVDVKPGVEQPVTISYENDDGKPWRPCKSMARCLVTAWGPDSKKYIGKSLTLYCDSSVKWGGMNVGGIRISHMSDIPESLTMALTVTRANKKPFTVKPLAVSEPAIDYAATLSGAATLPELVAAWGKIPKSEQSAHLEAKDKRKVELSKPVDKPVDKQDGWVESYTAAEAK